MTNWSCSGQESRYPFPNIPQSSPKFLAHFSLCPIRSFRSRNSWHLAGAMHVAPGCQTLASATVASTPHFFAPRRCSTPTRVPKPRAGCRARPATSTPPQNPAPISPSCYYHITVQPSIQQGAKSLVGRKLSPSHLPRPVRVFHFQIQFMSHRSAVYRTRRPDTREAWNRRSSWPSRP